MTTAFDLGAGAFVAAAGLLAQSPDGGAAALMQWFPVVMIVGIFYFLVFRPQKKKEDDRQELIKRLRKNDHVITNSGMHGTVTNVKDDEVTLRVDDALNVRIKFSRSSIAGIVEGQGDDEDSGSK